MKRDELIKKLEQDGWKYNIMEGGHISPDRNTIFITNRIPYDDEFMFFGGSFVDNEKKVAIQKHMANIQNIAKHVRLVKVARDMYSLKAQFPLSIRLCNDLRERCECRCGYDFYNEGGYDFYKYCPMCGIEIDWG